MKYKPFLFLCLVLSIVMPRLGFAGECTMSVTPKGEVEVVFSIKEIDKLIKSDLKGDGPVIDLESTPSWYGEEFDLIYDGKWVKIADTVAELNDDDCLIVRGTGGYVKGPLYGIRFVAGDEWERFASGKKIRVSLTVKSADGHAVRYKVMYTTYDVGSSSWKESIAGKGFTTFSFDYTVPKLKDGKKDFVIVVFESTSENKKGIIIKRATLDVIKP